MSCSACILENITFYRVPIWQKMEISTFTRWSDSEIISEILVYKHIFILAPLQCMPHFRLFCIFLNMLYTD